MEVLLDQLIADTKCRQEVDVIQRDELPAKHKRTGVTETNSKPQ